MMLTRTKNSTLDSAEICRRNKWRRGTILIGKENGYNKKLRITAVGDEQILGIFLGHDNDFEDLVELTARNWKRQPAARARKERDA